MRTGCVKLLRVSVWLGPVSHQLLAKVGFVIGWVRFIECGTSVVRDRLLASVWRSPPLAFAAARARLSAMSPLGFWRTGTYKFWKFQVSDPSILPDIRQAVEQKRPFTSKKLKLTAINWDTIRWLDDGAILEWNVPCQVRAVNSWLTRHFDELQAPRSRC